MRGLKRPRLRAFSCVLTAFLTVGGIFIPQNNFNRLNRLKWGLNRIYVFRVFFKKVYYWVLLFIQELKYKKINEYINN